MTTALKENNADFVNLLLEKGVNMQEFLSISRLEELYKNVKWYFFLKKVWLFNFKDINNENALKFIIHEIAEVDDDYNYNLIDIGKVVEKLMGMSPMSITLWNFMPW